MELLAGRRALITGIASERSIAYAIASCMHEQGAELLLTYQNDRLKDRVSKAAALFGDASIVECDVAHDASIESLTMKVQEHWPEGFDILIHALAFAPPEQLQGDYLQSVNREGFRIAHDISAYSLSALCQALAPLMRSGGSVLTLSYLGAERVVPFYNVMGLAKASLEASVRYLAQSLGPQGIRVNGISAGPIKTLAASGIRGLREMIAAYERTSPLRSSTTAEQVAQTSVFLCSPWASGITAEIIHVDSGFHALAPLPFEEQSPA